MPTIARITARPAKPESSNALNRPPRQAGAERALEAGQSLYGEIAVDARDGAPDRRDQRFRVPRPRGPSRPWRRWAPARTADRSRATAWSRARPVSRPRPLRSRRSCRCSASSRSSAACSTGTTINPKRTRSSSSALQPGARCFAATRTFSAGAWPSTDRRRHRSDARKLRVPNAANAILDAEPRPRARRPDGRESLTQGWVDAGAPCRWRHHRGCRRGSSIPSSSRCPQAPRRDTLQLAAQDEQWPPFRTHPSVLIRPRSGSCSSSRTST